MRKSLLIAALIMTAQISFADDATMNNNAMQAATPMDATAQSMPAAPASTADADKTSCKTIATACLNGGYSHKGGPGKSFWKDCMHPILLGKTVASINVDATDVQACKQIKISKMQKELQEFQATAPAQAQ